MKSRLQTPELAASSRVPRVTVWYEDLAAALRANLLCEELIRTGALPKRFETEFWRFDFLSIAAQARAAREMAVRSELMIISAQRQNSFSYEVEMGVNMWMQTNPKRTYALAVLLGGNEVESVYSRVLLAQWWHRARQQDIAMYCDLPEWRRYSTNLSQFMLPRVEWQSRSRLKAAYA